MKAWAALILAVLLAAGGLWLYTRHQDAKVEAAFQETAELKGQVDALKQEAQGHQALADQAGQAIAAQDQQIATLKAKLQKLNAAAPRAQTVAGPDGSTRPDPAPGPELAQASALKDQIIEAQDQQITALKLEVSDLRLALDAQGRALTASEQRARGLEIALDAQRHAAASGKWLYRFQGLAVGIGVGYITGKVH